MDSMELSNGPAAEVSPTTGTTNNSVPNGNGDSATQTAGTITVSAEDFALIEEAKRERRERGLNDRVKLHNKILSSRRITVALRRVDLKTVAPDRDVLAYIEVCNMKAVAGQKSEASEQEMAAYLTLFSQGVESPTLEAINSHITQQ